MDKYKLYSALKGFRITPELIAAVEKMTADQLREGVLEYLTMLLHARR